MGVLISVYVHNAEKRKIFSQIVSLGTQEDSCLESSVP
jgi:hypothetical protein